MLDEFIILGLIPGTQVQITFYMWLTLASSIAGLVTLWRGYRTELLQRMIITGEIIALTHSRLPEQIS